MTELMKKLEQGKLKTHYKKLGFSQAGSAYDILDSTLIGSLVLLEDFKWASDGRVGFISNYYDGTLISLLFESC